MRYPAGLVLDSARHILTNKISRNRRFPMMLSLHVRGGSPLLNVEQCLAAMEECHSPLVSIGGPEPLEHPHIAALTRAILQRGRHLFINTDGALIRCHLHMIPPLTNFFWNVFLDGTQKVHDARANRPGLFREAIDGIRAAKNAGFFVLVSSTVYPDTDISDLSALFEQLHAAHVDGYILQPHYPRERFCRDGSARFHQQMHQRFREAADQLASYNLMISPIYMEYLRGERELDCSVWGNPVYAPQGWASPCALLQARFAPSYKALLQETVWENYGRGLNPRCENCQCLHGYETAAILGVSGKAGDFWKLIKWQLGGSLGEKRNGRRWS